ncbi:MAG: oligosaccharide flippase family protein [Rhizobiales bacterium]|nr:oligosaccharide flippase family protein [Hyphomicrobiales bacterium]
MNKIKTNSPEVDSTATSPYAGRKLAFGAMALGGVNLVKVALQLLLLPVMARLLGPEEFGIYALVLPTISFVTLLADGGLGATLAREPESSSIVWSSAFWILLFTGCALAVGASVFGEVLGYLVHQPRVPPMIATLSISLIFLVLAVPAGARLSRRKNLGASAAAELSANLVGAAVAVILAMNGAGAWSLVFQYVAAYAIRSIVVNAVAFSAPKFEFDFAAVRPHMLSGGLLVGTRLSEYAGRIVENVLVDRIFGTALLGSYTFANQVSKFAGESIGNVTWTTLYVQALTGERRSIAELHRQLCRLLAAILFPSTLLAAAAAPELIHLLLGPKWVDLALLLQVLLPVSALTMVANQVGAALLAYGRFEIQFWCSAGQSLARVLVVCAGPWIGLTGTIWGLAIVALVYFISLLVYSEGPTGCRPLPMLKGLTGPAICGVLAGAACYACLRALPNSAGWTLTSLVLGLSIFAASMLVLDREGLTEDWQAIRALMSKRGEHPLPTETTPGPA